MCAVAVGTTEVPVWGSKTVIARSQSTSSTVYCSNAYGPLPVAGPRPALSRKRRGNSSRWLGTPSIDDERLTQHLPGRIRAARLSAYLQTGMGYTGGPIAGVHLLGVGLPGVQHGRIGNGNETGDLTCGSFARRCQCQVEPGEPPFVPLVVAGFQLHDDGAHFSVAYGGVIGTPHPRLEPRCRRLVDAVVRRDYSLAQGTAEWWTLLRPLSGKRRFGKVRLPADF
jgi:hypothetical protein